MATAAQSRTRQLPPHSDLKHGPVAAAVNASVVTLCLTTLGKLIGLPPWLALVVGVAMAASLVWSGKHRRPRPLSRHSLVYRAVAMMLAAGWMFWQLADFPDTAGVAGGIAATGTALALIPVGFLGMKLVSGPWKILIPIVVAGIGAGLLGAYGMDLFAWVAGTLTTTDRLPMHDWPAVGGWLGYALISLAVLTAPTVVLGVAFANREQSADDELDRARHDVVAGGPHAQARAMQRLLCDEFGEWQDMRDPETNQVTGRRATIRIVGPPEFWPNGAGEHYTVDLRGNIRSTTITRVNSAKENLVTKLGLPDGCGVEVLKAPGEGKGFVRLSVSRVDRLKDVVYYPELMPRSILNPLPIGIDRAGVEIGPLLRESSAFVWGQKGSGKTVTVSDLIAGGIQCTNCLVWVIDLNGGSAAAPFLAGFEDGDVDRPCIDWVATDIAEVRRMAEVGLAIALDRKVYYRKLKQQQNTNLMPIGNGGPGQPPPEILIIIDEGAEVLGIGGGQITDDGRAARVAVDSIMRLARDAAVNIIFSGLRATSDVADPAFLHGTAVRIGMRVSDQQELAYGFGDWKLDPNEIPHQGSGFIKTSHDSDIQVFKAYFLDPNRMRDIGLACTPWRPYLDEQGVQVGGWLYADRWRRTAHKIFSKPRPEVANYGGLARPAGAAPTGPAGPALAGGTGTGTAVLDRDDVAARGALPPTGGDSFEDLLNSARQHSDREPDDLPAPPPAGSEGGGASDDGVDGEEKSQADYDAEFKLMAEKMNLDDPSTWHGSVPIPPDAEIAAVNRRVDSRAVLEQLVRMAGPDGIAWAAMHKALRAGGDWGPAVPISAPAMSKLLKRPGTGEPVEWLAPRGKTEPYIHLSQCRPDTP